MRLDRLFLAPSAFAALAACGSVSETEPDAAVDADITPVCTEGTVETCYTGPAASLGRGVCRSGTRTCTDGAWPAACVDEIAPTAEVCDGEDDDCDGTIDDGCPQAGTTVRGATTQGAVLGGTTTHGTANIARSLECPLGSAIVGFWGRSSNSIDRLGVVCAPLTVVQAGAIGTPRTFTIAVGAPSPSDTFGGTGGTPFDARCPDGTVVVGTSVWTADAPNGTSLYGLTFTCSVLAASGTPGDAALRATGTPTESDRIGEGNASLTPTRVDAACAAGSALSAITTYVGPWPLYIDYTTINAVRFDCTALNAVLEPVVP
ncbi:MAG: hypothetical protein ACTHU0_24235 [Kofleriaceae bacterium]